jgi:site-specific recombinase XerD
LLKTDQEIIDMWLYGKADRTIVEYRATVREFQALTRKSLADIDLQDLQGFSRSLEQRKLKATSIARHVKAIKSLFSFAAKQTHIPFNVAAALQPPKTSTDLAGRILTRAQVDLLIESATGERGRLFILCLYALALRLFEACNLEWQHFSVQGSGKVQVMVHGKGGKVAPVVVPNSVWEKLQVLRGDSAKVFDFGKRTGHDIVKQSVARAGLDSKISAHWLRHSHARHAIEAGAKIHVVRDTLRHSSIATTNWYLESFPDESSSDYLGF